MKRLATFMLLLLALLQLSGLEVIDSLTCKGDLNLLSGYPAIAADSLVNMIVEIPAGTNQKWEVKSDGLMHWDMKNGVPRVVKYLPYPGNYGMIPSTCLSKTLGGDGDPVDVILLAPACERGSLVQVRILGSLRYLDDGAVDDKLIAVSASSPLWACRSLAELQQHFPGAVEILQLFFNNYKGPGEMEFLGTSDRPETLQFLDKAISAFGSADEK